MKQDFIRYIKKTVMRLVLSPLKLLPIKQKQILIINDLGYNYSGNPRFIADYLVKNYPNKFIIYYSVKCPKKYSSKNTLIKFIKFNSIEYFLCALTSKIIISNSGGYSYIPHRKKQIIINTHHGGGALKATGIDMFGDTFWFRKDMKLFGNSTDIYLSTNTKFSDVVSKATLVPRNRFWEIGMPRNDCLININNEDVLKIKNKIGLKDYQKLVLFAPTYRKLKDNYFLDSISIQYGINPIMVCDALKKRFCGDWIFGLRLHPCVVNKESYKLNFVIDLSSYEDIQDLLLAADVLITDFSSSMWDFMLTKKPCFLFALDKENYIKTTKVYTPISELPYPFASSNKELSYFIMNFDEKKYQEDCQMYYNKLGGCETGKATEILVKKIVEIVES